MLAGRFAQRKMECEYPIQKAKAECCGEDFGTRASTNAQLDNSRPRANAPSWIRFSRCIDSCPSTGAGLSQRLHATLPVALTERISPNPRLRIVTKNIIHSASKSGREPICRDRIIPSMAKKHPLKFLIILVALLAAGGGY